MQSQTKSIIAISILATILLMTAVTVSVPNEVSAVKKTDGKEKKVKTCKNVKIQVNVENANSTNEIEATATLNGFVTSKTVEVNETESSVTIPLNFKKINPCPEIGNIFMVDVNGIIFNGELTSTKKPNKITVTLP